MRKWTYKTLSHLGTVTTTIDGDEIEAESGTEFYVAAEVDAMLRSLYLAIVNGADRGRSCASFLEDPSMKPLRAYVMNVVALTVTGDT